MSDKNFATDYPRDFIDQMIIDNSPYAFYFFAWVDYQNDAKKWRLKMLHDAKAFDGREVHGVWPNGNSFGELKDDEVEYIRISKQQHGYKYTDPRLDAGS